MSAFATCSIHREDALGLYKAFHSDGPMTYAALASRAKAVYANGWAHLTCDPVAATLLAAIDGRR